MGTPDIPRQPEDLQLLADQDLLCDGAVVVADRALEALVGCGM